MAPKRHAVAGAILPAKKVKRIMQEDDDVGRIAEKSCVLAARSAEMLARDLIEASAADAVARGSAVIDIDDVKSAVARTELFDFVREVVDVLASKPDEQAGRKPERATKPSPANPSAPG
ncbi:hypothetical protein T492DRAFT_1018752 [Pavlovales sp. CCMP2436]|nr:hypothetical protein T492DRAFT_1018752 [Pavlovales sp. CCMP2436]|mmetsp:Transcript_17074/g.43754  ORF Transcript_17074/g.43754 Transcript_17074/m.43754 type:complete len:119 (-) Transcript_17074:317-673(-)